MILYHGGTDIIERPEIREPNRGLDFGAGFYTTTNVDQAVQYAFRMRDVRQRRDKNNAYNAVVSVFEFDFTAASACCDVLQFSQTNEEWLDFITENRRKTYSGKQYDIIIGPMADDKVYDVVNLYQVGGYDKEEALKRLKVVKAFNQYVLATEKALSYLTFMRYQIEEGNHG